MHRGIRSCVLLCVSFFLVSSANAGGPFSHFSNGTTQPLITVGADGPDDDASGDVLSISCIDGSRCSVKSGNLSLTATSTQTSKFDISTGGTAYLNANDHFAFGTRGNRANANCGPESNVRSMPFLGRGITIHPNTKTVAFENFTTNCLDSGGRAASTAHGVQYWGPNRQFVVWVWANDANVGYDLWEKYLSPEGIYDLRYSGSGDCLSMASSAEDYLCAAHPNDDANADRGFIAMTADGVWSISNWWLIK